MSDPSTSSRPTPSARRLTRLVGLARVAHLWEQVWRGILPPLIVVGAFLCLSWLGLWFDVPRWGRAVGVVLFGLAFIVSCWACAISSR